MSFYDSLLFIMIINIYYCRHGGLLWLWYGMIYVVKLDEVCDCDDESGQKKNSSKLIQIC